MPDEPELPAFSVDELKAIVLTLLRIEAKPDELLGEDDAEEEDRS